MKRWLIASISLNLVLVGAVVGFFMTAALPPLPFFPPPREPGGIRADLQNVIKVLDGEAQAKARAIVERNFMGLQQEPPGGVFSPSGPKGLIDHFQDGTLTANPPDASVKRHEFRQKEFFAAHHAIYEIGKLLNQKQRDKIAEAMRARLRELRGACHPSKS